MEGNDNWSCLLPIAGCLFRSEMNLFEHECQNVFPRTIDASRGEQQSIGVEVLHARTLWMRSRDAIAGTHYTYSTILDE